MQTTTLQPGQRIHFLDLIRVVACYMVIMVHSCEFFYVFGDIVGNNGFWVNLFDSALRSCVPLFVMVSSYLLVPIEGSEWKFFKKRFLRVLIPFAIWSLLYALVPYSWSEFNAQTITERVTRLAYNFNPHAGHLWFVYMLIGIYLFMPVISPWLKQTSRKAELAFLGLWFATTFYHYVKLGFGVPELFGECFWNEFTPIWYFSGYIGYVVLAHYIRTYIHWSARKCFTVGASLFLMGYAITYVLFGHMMSITNNITTWEIPWRFCTPNVVMMTLGLFLIMKPFSPRKNTRALSLLGDVSRLSYGMYLMHMFFLTWIFTLISPYFSTPITIILVGTTTFVLCYFITKLLSYLPKSKYLIG